jgi:hypothetical protein
VQRSRDCQSRDSARDHEIGDRVVIDKTCDRVNLLCIVGVAKITNDCRNVIREICLWHSANMTFATMHRQSCKDAEA